MNGSELKKRSFLADLLRAPFRMMYQAYAQRERRLIDEIITERIRLEFDWLKSEMTLMFDSFQSESALALDSLKSESALTFDSLKSESALIKEACHTIISNQRIMLDALHTDNKGIAKKMSARALFLKQRRFDLTFKALFLQHRDSEYFRALYLEHMRAFNNFYERCPVKTLPENFIDDFLVLDRAIDTCGYDDDSIIYTDANLQIMNGAHRLACAALHDLDVPVSIGSSRDWWTPDYGHFLQIGLNRGTADHNALEYVKAVPNAWVLQLHAAADLKHEVDVHDILTKYGFIYYAKSVRLSENAYLNLTLLNYGNEGARGEWVGTKADGFAGARAKALRCMGPNPLRVIVFVCDDQENVIRAKNELRELYSLGNDSCHINDTHAQAVAVAEMFFNANSLAVLERRNALADTDALDKRLDVLKNFMDPERTVCCGSSPLNAAGLRVAADLDCLSLDEITSDLKTSGISDHTEVLHLYPFGKRAIIENPALHFWYRGVKFVSLEVMLAMKEKRGEQPKDIHDCALMHSFLNDG